MKKLLCFFLVILVLVSPALAADGSTLVYTTRTGECYHRYSCSSLSKSCYETTLSQAVADGYRPCGRCHPPTLDSGSSYSGYSSGSSSYSSGYSSGQSSSIASASSSRAEKDKGLIVRILEKIVAGLALIFIVPPFSFITWSIISVLRDKRRGR